MNFNATIPDTKASILNEVTSVPQLLYQSEGGHLSAHITGPLATGRGQVVQGMAVTNKEMPGVIAYAHVPPPTLSAGPGGGPEQGLICTIHGNNVEPCSRHFRFKASHPALGQEREPQMMMHVENLNCQGTFSDGNGNSNLIPLIPAPGSIAIAEPLTRAELELMGAEIAPEFDFSSILRGVIKSVPILAEAGLQIYEQVSGGNATSTPSRGRHREDDVTFLPGLGAIANIALPFVGSLIKGITG